MPRFSRSTLLILAGTGLWSARLGAQQADQATGEALNVYVDCQTFGCDQDFFRTEIPWVNWVRDRQVSDVHVLVTAQSTGAGGRQFDLAFLGRRSFAGMSDTLQTSIAPAATSDETRQALVRTLRLGLVRFAAQTPVAERIQIAVAGADGEPVTTPATPADDPWDFWVFRISMNGFLNGESQTSFRRLSGSLRASRITEEWKITINGSGSSFHSRFDLPDTTINTRRESYDGTLLVANSWGAHWSGGAIGSIASSTFGNFDLSLRVAPAIEYNLFPYDESTRRQMTARYSIGPAVFDYKDETIYGKTDDRFAEQRLEIGLEQQQPWGSVNVSLDGSHFWGWKPGANAPEELQTEGPRYSLSMFGGVSVRLFQGLSLNLGGRYSKIRNQIGLPRGEASEEEILLQLRQLETDFTYFVSMGLSYTFGSIYNNVVNPRFAGTEFF